MKGNVNATSVFYGSTFTSSHLAHRLPTSLFCCTPASRSIDCRIADFEAILQLELPLSICLAILAIHSFALRSWLVHLSILPLPPLTTAFLSNQLDRLPRTEPACVHRSLSETSILVQPATSQPKLFLSDLSPAPSSFQLHARALKDCTLISSA